MRILSYLSVYFAALWPEAPSNRCGAGEALPRDPARGRVHRGGAECAAPVAERARPVRGRAAQPLGAQDAAPPRPALPAPRHGARSRSQLLFKKAGTDNRERSFLETLWASLALP